MNRAVLFVATLSFAFFWAGGAMAQASSSATLGSSVLILVHFALLFAGVIFGKIANAMRSSAAVNCWVIGLVLVFALAAVQLVSAFSRGDADAVQDALIRPFLPVLLGLIMANRVARQRVEA